MASHHKYVANQLKTAFPEGLTPLQIQAIIAVAKLVRFRCKSNAALINALPSIFPSEHFNCQFSVQETTRNDRFGRPYNHRAIVVKDNITLSSNIEEEFND